MYLPTSILAELNHSVLTGVPWRAALAEIARGTELEDVAEQIGEGSLANWVWLADLGRRKRALDLCGGPGAMTAGLARHFAVVYYLESDQPLLSFSHTRFVQDGIDNAVTVRAGRWGPPFRDASFDCVALHGLSDRDTLELHGARSKPDYRTLLLTCHRLLRPGGCLYIGLSNLHWRGKLREITRGRIAPRPLLDRLLRQTGFRNVRRYYVAPSIHQPRTILPATRRAVGAYEKWSAVGGAKGVSRRLIAWSGLHFLLFPSQLILAGR